jgi:purine-binding chemotaxis protein CheW
MPAERESYRFATEDVWARRGKAQSAPQRDFLTFLVGDEEYAVDIQRIREIIKVRTVTEVPHVPPFVWGVIAVRGRVVPVIDLRVRLRLASPGLSRTARFLIVEKGEDDLYGLLVDEVRQVVRLTDAEIEPTPAMFSGPEGDFIAGIGRTKSRMVILLQLDQVLAFEVTGRRPHEGQERRGERR